MAAFSMKGSANLIAQNIRSANPGQFGAFPILELIPVVSAFIQLLAKCRKPDDPNAVKQQLKNEWDKITGDYSERTMNRAVKSAHRAAKKEGRKLSRIQAEEIARATLDHIRTASVSEIRAAMSEMDEDFTE
jgi:ubiquinone biosynthesis protein UbiJ